MPECVDRLHGSGNNMLHELTRMLRQIPSGHDFILSEVELVPASQGLYNQA